MNVTHVVTINIHYILLFFVFFYKKRVQQNCSSGFLVEVGNCQAKGTGSY